MKEIFKSYKIKEVWELAKKDLLKPLGIMFGIGASIVLVAIGILALCIKYPITILIILFCIASFAIGCKIYYTFFD